MYLFLIPILFLLPIVTFGQDVQEDLLNGNHLSRESRQTLQDITDCSATYTICNDRGYVVDYDKNNIPVSKQDDLPLGGAKYEYFEDTGFPKSISIKSISLLGIGVVGARLNFREDSNIENAQLVLLGVAVKTKAPVYRFWDSGAIRSVEGNTDFEGVFQVTENYNEDGALLEEISTNEEEIQRLQFYPNGLVKSLNTTSTVFGESNVEWSYDENGDVSRIIEDREIFNSDGELVEGTITTEFRDSGEYVTTTFEDGTTKTDKIIRHVDENGEVLLEIIEDIQE